MIRMSNPAAALAHLAALVLAGLLALLVLPGLSQAQTAGAAALSSAASSKLGSTAAAVNGAAPAPVAASTPPPTATRRATPQRLAPEPVTGPGVLHIDLAASGSAARVLNLPFGKSAVVDLPADARDVLVTNPAVADAVLRTRRRISVLGVSPGETDAVFFGDDGQRILSLDIRVSKDSSGLADTLQRLLPGAHIRVEPVNDSLVLAGDVANAADADKAIRLAARFVAKPEEVVNLLTITGREQVMLKVRVVEMQRNIIKQLGFNMSAIYNQNGVSQYVLNSAATYGVNQSILGGASGGYKFQQNQPGQNGLNQASAIVQAFERVGLVRTLAEPNLTAISGESAKFLAGGEYPVPTGEDSTGHVTIEFKPYGVGLGFTPVVLSEGRISLKISTEVSELTADGAFVLPAAPGSTAPSLSIPGLKVRRTETTIELPSGGAMMIAGLLQQQTKQNLDALPGMMNLPVLGALFRSRDYQSGETELAIIVTPYLVDATSPDKLQTPADGFQNAGDLQTDLLGKLNTFSHAPAAALAGKTLQGPYGYVIE
jgi:pilus assembly protein CpaC